MVQDNVTLAEQTAIVFLDNSAKISCSCFHRSVGIFKKLLYNLQSLQATVCSNQQRDTKNLPQKGNMVHLLLVFLRNDSKLNNLFGLAKKKYIRRFALCLISTDILIRSLNNNAFEKCTNGNAFNIVTIAHFLVTLIQEHLEDLGCFLR